MKSSISTLITLGLVAGTNAFPSIQREIAAREAERGASLLNKVKRQVGFSTDQLIPVDGEHAFVPPGPGDARGPCPGLNAMANHGYLPHNGVATIDEFVKQTAYVFGMGADLGTFLAVYGAVVDGDGTSWSIGGPNAAVNGIGSLLSTPQGISGSHNKYEGDSSPTRGDLYEYGNDYKLVMSQFQALYDLGKADDNYDLDVLTKHRANRFQQSIENNAYFFYPPFAGVIVVPAAYTFIYRYMGNKSEEYPEGYLNGEVLKSFFAITGDDGNFTYTEGWERIPENWYTRAADDPYGITGLTLDTQAMGLQHPEFLVPGGNTGTENSYVGLDPSNLSGGVYNAGNIAENNNAECLAYQLTLQFLPDILRGTLDDIAQALNQSGLGGQFEDITQSLGCPQLQKIDESQFNIYPGNTAENYALGTY
ncbi:hypothetical protein MBLNU457_1161t1 [Dothideomycetes sp. NU457]